MRFTATGFHVRIRCAGAARISLVSLKARLETRWWARVGLIMPLHASARRRELGVVSVSKSTRCFRRFRRGGRRIRSAMKCSRWLPVWRRCFSLVMLISGGRRSGCSCAIEAKKRYSLLKSALVARMVRGWLAVILLIV